MSAIPVEKEHVPTIGPRATRAERRAGDSARAESMAIFVALAVSVYLSWLLIRAFLWVLAWAIVMPVLFDPVHDRLHRRLPAGVAAMRLLPNELDASNVIVHVVPRASSEGPAGSLSFGTHTAGLRFPRATIDPANSTGLPNVPTN